MSPASLVRSLVPRQLVGVYHLILAYTGAFLYGFPARRMTVIGVTGTRGKTTTANYLWAILTSAGFKVGLTGTANIRVGDTERVNPYHMTMPGRFVMQKLLAEMRRAGCEIAIVETPSEGVEQHRHRGIAYDAVVLTSLYPEYLEVHGWDFGRCKRMMETIFASLHRMPRKKLRGTPVPKTIAVNADAEGHEPFLNHPADKKITYGLRRGADLTATDIVPSADAVRFSVKGHAYELRLPGSFNVGNALGAIAVADALGIPTETIRRGIASLTSVPGRMEPIVAGQAFRVFVDYAHDGPSMEAVLTAARTMRDRPDERIIVLLGAEGGGRDKKKRPVMGRLAGELADQMVVTNVDPYEDDPVPILEDIAEEAERYGKTRGETLHVIEDRRAGIQKALALAKPGDLVFITGKGAEQSMVVGGTTFPWDDRTVVREELARCTETK